MCTCVEVRKLPATVNSARGGGGGGGGLKGTGPVQKSLSILKTKAQKDTVPTPGKYPKSILTSATCHLKQTERRHGI